MRQEPGIPGVPGIRTPGSRLEDLRLLASVVGQLGAGTDERAFSIDEKFIRPQALVELSVLEVNLVLAGDDHLLWYLDQGFLASGVL